MTFTIAFTAVGECQSAMQHRTPARFRIGHEIDIFRQGGLHNEEIEGAGQQVAERPIFIVWFQTFARSASRFAVSYNRSNSFEGGNCGGSVAWF